MDGDLRHEVWYLDAVTALNEMRGARNLGINTFALWRLGAEDRSLWSIWDIPRDPAGPAKLRSVPPGHDIDLEGKGDILRIAAEPEWGWRDVSVSPDNNLITSETFAQLPLPYQLEEYGGSANKIAITFDDGPDPTYTPKMLEVLKAKNATATFFLIGDEAAKFPGLAQRIYDEGNEIGNHTFFHPDVSNLSTEDVKLQMNSTERFFEANLGVKPLFFRPPYAIDEEPDVDEQVEPLRLVQALGYITVGSKIDPHDWQLKPVRPTAQGIAEDVLRQVTEPRPQTGCFHPPCGNVVLLHDGGGDRSATVQALPLIIDGLRAHGFQIVPLSELIGKTRDQVMLPIGANERWSSIVSRLGFDLWYGIAYHAIILAFFFGNILMTARLLIIGALAIFDRLCAKRAVGAQEFQLPTVAVLIPAFNEEKVIVRTVEAVLACDYPKGKLRAFVIDDGSSDETVSVTEAAFPAQIASGRLRVISKPNAGKADALNRGLREVIEEVFVGIDADTVIAPAAIKRLVAHFEDAKVGAVAGNTKVGNRVNLWTRWQALEYITSQNFERRALDALGAVTVVPGALGAWRTEAVGKAGGYHLGTVAEDADLTMSLLEAGYRVEYEDRALAYTEAPTTANALMRQRFRWSFGILQAVWKHLSAFRRGGVLGWIALPNILIFQIILPIVSPAIDLMFFVGLLSYFADKHFHPATANPASIEKLALFFVIFLITDFIASLIAFSLERREDDSEDFWLLGQVWLQRFAYRQLFSLVLFKTVKRAIDGRPFSWDKLERTAAVRRRQASASASS
jgi:cellulose synthase/poly-beta-1,6-N-acetylglucosamine synthase-like glycosyltransferase/peptidoglycan/xylan/chitin deacetylase (PgdA/CDA1 family)